MTVDKQRRKVLGMGATAALAGLSGCSGATPFVGKRLEEEQTLDIGDDDTVSVVGDNGDVTVRTGESPRLKTVKKSGSVFSDLSDTTLTSSKSGNSLRIEAQADDEDSWLRGTPAIDLTAEIPDGVTVETVRSQNGDVDVRGVTGDTTVETENGDATARDIDGSVTVNNENGNVDVRNIDGSATVETRNQDATVRAVSGFVSAKTENGDVTVRNIGGLDAAKTSNGDVAVDVPAVREDVRVETENGEIDASVSPDIDARLVLETDLGELSLNAPFEAVTQTEDRIEAGPEDAETEVRFSSETGDVSVSSLE